MTQALAEILKEVDQLSIKEKVELADLLVERLGNDIPGDVAEEQLATVRQRIAEVESGAVQLIPGEEALLEVRRIISK